MKSLLRNLDGDYLEIFVDATEVDTLKIRELEGNVYDFDSLLLANEKQKLRHFRWTLPFPDGINYVKTSESLEVSIDFRAYKLLLRDGAVKTFPTKIRPYVYVANIDKIWLSAAIKEKLSKIK